MVIIGPLFSYHRKRLAVVFLQGSHMLIFLSSLRLVLKSHLLLKVSLTVFLKLKVTALSHLSYPLSYLIFFLSIVLIFIEQIFYSNLLCLLPASLHYSTNSMVIGLSVT